MGTLVEDRVFKIDYTGSQGALVLPESAYPTKIKFSDNLVSRSWNDMYGRFHDIPVNLKYKIMWEWEALNKGKINEIMSYMRGHILNDHSRIFTITTSYPGYIDYYQTEVYLGTPIDFESVGACCVRQEKGNASYYRFEIHFIETKGHKLL